MGRKNRDGAPETGPQSSADVAVSTGAEQAEAGQPAEATAPGAGDPQVTAAPIDGGDEGGTATPSAAVAPAVDAPLAPLPPEAAPEPPTTERKPPCPNCTDERPCSVECWVAAGYDAEIFATRFPPLPKPKAEKAGHTICKITGSAVMYHGEFVPEGTVGEFEDGIVLAHPTIFISQE